MRKLVAGVALVAALAGCSLSNASQTDRLLATAVWASPTTTNEERFTLLTFNSRHDLFVHVYWTPAGGNQETTSCEGTWRETKAAGEFTMKIDRCTPDNVTLITAQVRMLGDLRSLLVTDDSGGEGVTFTAVPNPD